MEQKKIDRISELSRKARTSEGLTPEEQQERMMLRAEYVRAVTENLEAQLRSVVVVDEHGHKTGLKKEEEEPNGRTAQPK